MRTLLALAIVAGLTAAAAADDADPKAKAAAEFAEGQRLYDANLYPAAAAKFKAAWALDPDPAYLFNIAQALRFAKQCGEAGDYYRKFLAQVTSAPNLDKVQEYLAEVDACAKAQQLLPPQQPPPPPPPVHERSDSKRGLVIAGAGLVAVGVGIWFHWDAHYFTGRHDSYNATCSVQTPCMASELTYLDDKGHHAQTFAIVFDSVGVAALAAGAMLYVFRDRGGEQPPVAVSPMRGGGMVTTGWRF
jgi:hypothetical protein